MRKAYWILISLAVVLVTFLIIKSRTPPKHPDPVEISLEELAFHDGVQRDSVYLSFQGYVFDVSSVTHYKKGVGSYQAFGARECSIALVRGQFEDKYMNQLIDGENDKEKADIQYWLEFYVNKYPLIGYLKGWRTREDALRITKKLLKLEGEEISAPFGGKPSQQDSATQADN